MPIYVAARVKNKVNIIYELASIIFELSIVIA
jgi:hypothetical protein